MSQNLTQVFHGEQSTKTHSLEEITPWLPGAQGKLDISAVKQLGNGWACCTEVSVCDMSGRPALVFEQGETACFYFEFELARDMDVPIGGVLLRNDHNVNVHGKTTLEYGAEVPQSVKAGERLRFRQEIALEVGIGEYSFDVGLTTMTAADYQKRGDEPQEELNKAILLICLLMNIGRVRVAARTSGSPIRLLHHGLANLPGGCTLSVMAAPRGHRRRVEEPMAKTDLPPVFHITHWKAGSQWIRNILGACAPEGIVPSELCVEANLRRGIVPGKIYAPAYLTVGEFKKLPLPKNVRHFIVLRDLRDTLVSAYFSVKMSHSMSSQDLAGPRSILNSTASQEEGMLYMLEHWLPGAARIQQSWLEAAEPFIRYEDLLEHDTQMLERVLIEQCGLPISRQRLDEAVAAHRFEALTGGRPRGHEDLTAHERKGIAGDWRNHFTDWIKRIFKIRYGGLLIAAGYEQDMNW